MNHIQYFYYYGTQSHQIFCLWHHFGVLKVSNWGAFQRLDFQYVHAKVKYEICVILFVGRNFIGHIRFLILAEAETILKNKLYNI